MSPVDPRPLGISDCPKMHNLVCSWFNFNKDSPGKSDKLHPFERFTPPARLGAGTHKPYLPDADGTDSGHELTHFHNDLGQRR